MEEKEFKASIDLKKLIIAQRNISKRVTLKKVEKMENIICTDVAYRKNRAISVAVLYDLLEKKVKGIYCDSIEVNFPYIPTFLSFREAPAILKVLKSVKEEYDIIVVDGQGLAHPRMAGLATFIGVLTNKPTIGIAKSFLYGEIKDDVIFVNGVKVGIKFGKYYASIGSNIDFESLLELLKKIDFKYPEGLEVADKVSKFLARNYLKVKNLKNIVKFDNYGNFKT